MINVLPSWRPPKAKHACWKLEGPSLGAKKPARLEGVGKKRVQARMSGIQQNLSTPTQIVSLNPSTAPTISPHSACPEIGRALPLVSLRWPPRALLLSLEGLGMSLTPSLCIFISLTLALSLLRATHTWRVFSSLDLSCLA